MPRKACSTGWGQVSRTALISSPISAIGETRPQFVTQCACLPSDLTQQLATLQSRYTQPGTGSNSPLVQKSLQGSGRRRREGGEREERGRRGGGGVQPHRSVSLGSLGGAFSGSR